MISARPPDGAILPACFLHNVVLKRRFTMYTNEGATATLAVESGDRGFPYPDDFRLEPNKSGMGAGPRRGVARSFRKHGLPSRVDPARVDEAEMSAPPEVTPEEAAKAAYDSAVDKKIFTGALAGLMSGDADTRALAAKAMSCIRHKLSGRALVAQLARETSVSARAECINALTKLEAKEGLPAVVDALDDEHAAVRLAAVRGTYRLAGREGAGLLVRMLHDASEDVRRRAATCLGWLDHKPAAVDLLSLLADPHAFVRGAAVDALANIGSSRAVPGITELLEDPVESVRRRSYLALQFITGGRMAETFHDEGRLSTDAQATGTGLGLGGKAAASPRSRPFGQAGAPALVHGFAA
jgi:hypothetical protein